MNRHALLSLGLLITGIAAAVPGCGDETSNGNGNKGGDAGAAGKDAGGEPSGGTGNVVKPSAGAGGEGAAQSHGGAGGSPEGGTTSAGAGGVATGGAGGEGGGEVDFGDCLGSGALGDLGLVDGAANTLGDPGGAAWYGILRVEGTNAVQLAVEIYNEVPPFAEGLTTLSNYVLTDADLNFQTCGVCLSIAEVNSLSVPTRSFFVTGGTVTLTNVDGRLSGSASNLTFEEVTVDDDFLSTPVPGGCRSSIKSVSFDESTGEGGAGGGSN